MGGGRRGEDDGTTSGITLVTGPHGIGRTRTIRDIADRLGIRPIAGLATLADVRHLLLSRLTGTDLGAASSTEAVEQLLAATPGPIVVDDAQDVDDDSLVALVAVADQRPVVLAWRDDVPLPDLLATHDRVDRRPVLPLDRPAADELARSAGADDPAGLAHRSGGNPGLLLTLCRDDDQGEHRRAIDALLATLGDAARRSLALLHPAGQEPIAPALVEDLENLAAAHLAAHDDRGVRCTHGLAAEMAWEALDTSAQLDLRRRLIDDSANPVVAVDQRLVVGDVAGAVAAARDALAAADPRTAVRLGTLVAAHTDDPADHLAVATAAVRFTDGATALAHAAGHPLRAAQAHRLLGALDRATETLAGIDVADPDADTAEKADLAQEVEHERALLVARTQAIRPDTDPRDALVPAALADLLVGAALDPAGLRGLADTAIAAGDLDTATTAQVLALAATLVAPDPDAASAFAHLVGLGERTGAPLPSAAARLEPALGLHLGSHGAGIVDALADVDGPVAATHVVLALAHAGRTGDAAALVDADRWPTTPVWRSIRAWLRAEVALLAGRLVSARNAAEQAAEPVPATFPAVDLAALVAARAAAEAGESPPSHTARSVLAPFVAVELDALATDDADRFAAAADAWSGRHHPAVLRCRLAAAERRLPAPDAVAAVEATAAEAERLGFRVLASAARRALHRSGVRTRADSGTRGGTLSPREREVLRHVAQGASSREIGNLIGVAPSTVDTQVKSAMQKLGARTRLQAAALAAELEDEVAS